MDDLNVSYCKVTSEGLKLLNWDVIKYIGFQGCDVEDLNFIKMNCNLKYLEWSI